MSHDIKYIRSQICVLEIKLIHLPQMSLNTFFRTTTLNINRHKYMLSKSHYFYSIINVSYFFVDKNMVIINKV